MKIPQLHIDASHREIEKCEWLLNHIAAVEAQTGELTDLTIMEHKKLLRTRAAEHTTFLNDVDRMNKNIKTVGMK